MAEEKSNDLLTREQLLAKSKRRFLEFEIPNFGLVRVRSLTERERSNYEADVMGSKGEYSRNRMIKARRQLIALTVVDASGNLLLNQPGDIKTLQDQDGSITDAIFGQVLVHCGITQNDIEILVKNSDGDLDGS